MRADEVVENAGGEASRGGEPQCSPEVGYRWSTAGAIASAGTVAATLFCCLPFASGHRGRHRCRGRRCGRATSDLFIRGEPCVSCVRLLSDVPHRHAAMRRASLRNGIDRTEPMAGLVGGHGGRVAAADEFVVGKLDHLLDVVTMRGLERRSLLALAGVATMIAGLAANPAPPPQATASAVLQDLHGLDELKTAFNRDAGTVRVILLLSPT